MGWGEFFRSRGDLQAKAEALALEVGRLREENAEALRGYVPLLYSDRCELDWWREFRTRQGKMSQLPPVGKPFGGGQFAVFDLTTRAAEAQFYEGSGGG